MDTPRYQKGLIYKLCCKDSTIKDCYVGSTCNFRKRKADHKSCCNNENGKSYNYPVYRFIRDHGGWDNFEMIELLKYPCETKRELALKEREYLELLGGTLNKQIPTRSPEEHYKENKEKISLQLTAYNLAHKEEIKEYKKDFYQKNKEQIIERAKVHYYANKKEINEKQREKFNCECGSTIRKSGKSTHLKSPKHQKFLNEIKE